MYIYLYDCKNARKKNARRVAFTKELYGYTYSWKTRLGVKEKRKSGLIDECPGAEAIADSAILVPEDHTTVFDSLFTMYRDTLEFRVFKVSREII